MKTHCFPLIGPPSPKSPLMVSFFGNPPKFRNYPLVGCWSLGHIHKSTAPKRCLTDFPRSRADASISAMDGSTALHLATQQGKLQVGPGWVARRSPPFVGLMKTHWGSFNAAVLNPYFWRGVRLTSHENWRKMKVKEGSDTFFWLGSHWYWLLMVQKSCAKTAGMSKTL